MWDIQGHEKGVLISVFKCIGKPLEVCAQGHDMIQLMSLKISTAVVSRLDWREAIKQEERPGRYLNSVGGSVSALGTQCKAVFQMEPLELGCHSSHPRPTFWLGDYVQCTQDF